MSLAIMGIDSPTARLADAAEARFMPRIRGQCAGAKGARTFDMAAKAGVQAISITPEGIFYQGRADIAKPALSRGLATCVWSKETFEPGPFLA
jgi:hypothetical protein